jgi:hypothetical protein
VSVIPKKDTRVARSDQHGSSSEPQISQISQILEIWERVVFEYARNHLIYRLARPSYAALMKPGNRLPQRF